MGLITRGDATPTESQMKLAIAQTLSKPFAYNAPVVVLDFSVNDQGEFEGKFKDAARPRVFEFELDGESVNYKPYKIERIDSSDVESWEEFSSGFSYRVDAGIATGGKKPQCVKPTAYNCGAACINIMKSCKTKTDDPTIKDRLKKLKTIGEDYAKTTPKTKAKKPPASTPELKPEPKKVAPEVKKQQSTNLVGDGTHEGTPRNAQEYYEAVIKTGKQITLKDARDTIDAVKYWAGSGSWNIRKDQKAGKPNERGDKIDEFIKNSTPYKGEIYRGLHFNSKEEALDLAKGGKDGLLGNQSAHASWTSDFKIASDFSNLNSSDENSAQVIIKSVNKSGVSIRNLSEFGGTNKTGVDEKEVVVSKETRHKVKNVKEENGIIIVEVEEVDSPPEKSSTKQEPVKQEKAEAQQQPLGQKVGKLTPSVASIKEMEKTAEEWIDESEKYLTIAKKVLKQFPDGEIIKYGNNKEIKRDVLKKKIGLVDDSNIVAYGLGISAEEIEPGVQDAVFLKDESGKTQGFFLTGNDKSKESMYIEFLGTNPSNIIKGTKGVGKQIIYHAIKESVKRGFKGKIKLESLRSAEPFYESVGFKKRIEKGAKYGYEFEYFHLSEKSAKAFVKEYEKKLK